MQKYTSSVSLRHGLIEKARFRLPCVKGAPPQAVRDCFFTLQPLRGFRTRLGDACKHAPHTCKSLTQGRRNPNPSRRGLQEHCVHSQISPTAARFPNPSRRRLQACFAHSQIPTGEGLIKNLHKLPDNRSFFCLSANPVRADN